MDVNAYLKRLNIEKRLAPDLPFLSHLQKQHMLRIPFENLDIIQGKTIQLDFKAFFNKLIVNKRGGFCYELNGLFYRLLQELVFETFMLSGQVARSEDEYGPEFDHMLLLVRFDKEYIVDVGFGDSVRSPLEISGKEVVDVSGTYRIKQDPFKHNGYFFQKLIEGKWISEFKFTTIPRQLRDFENMCHYQQTSPDSYFTHKPMITLATHDGRITLSGENLTITERGTKRKLKIASPQDLEKTLNDFFGISKC